MLNEEYTDEVGNNMGNEMGNDTGNEVRVIEICGILLPCVMRNGERYVSASMVQSKILSSFSSKYPPDLQTNPEFTTYCMTERERTLFEAAMSTISNEEDHSNTCFTVKDELIHVNEFLDFFERLQAFCLKSPKHDDVLHSPCYRDNISPLSPLPTLQPITTSYTSDVFLPSVNLVNFESLPNNISPQLCLAEISNNQNQFNLQNDSRLNHCQPLQVVQCQNIAKTDMLHYQSNAQNDTIPNDDFSVDDHLLPSNNRNCNILHIFPSNISFNENTCDDGSCNQIQTQPSCAGQNNNSSEQTMSRKRQQKKRISKDILSQDHAISSVLSLQQHVPAHATRVAKVRISNDLPRSSLYFILPIHLLVTIINVVY